MAETLLPLPDSPTSATVVLVGMSKEMPFTAANGSDLRSTRKRTSRFWTCRMSSGGVIALISAWDRARRATNR